MPIVHPHWLVPVLPATTRHVEVAGRVLPVNVTYEPCGVVAVHLETGCWGYGPDVEAAMADCQRMLDEDRQWYVERSGRTLSLTGTASARRAAIRAMFGDGE